MKLSFKEKDVLLHKTANEARLVALKNELEHSGSAPSPELTTLCQNLTQYMSLNANSYGMQINTKNFAPPKLALVNDGENNSVLVPFLVLEVRGEEVRGVFFGGNVDYFQEVAGT